MFILILWSCVFAAIFYYYAIKPLNFWKERGVLHKRPLWLFGDSLPLCLRREGFAHFCSRLYNRFKNARYFGCYQFTTPIFIVRDPELIKLITVKDFDHFLDHRMLLDSKVDPLFSKNLFGLRGQKWRDMRSILSPSFTSSKMKNIFSLMMENIDFFIKYLLDKDKDVIEIELKSLLNRLANDIIASSAFGIKVDSLNNPNNEFFTTGMTFVTTSFWMNLKLLGYITVPKFMALLKIPLFPKKAASFFFNIIEETVETRDKNNIVRPDMIQLLMDARKGKSLKKDENDIIDTGFATVQEVKLAQDNDDVSSRITTSDIAAQAIIFFFAGFDGVTLFISFICYELAVNPDIQDKLRDEIKETHASCSGKLTYEALMKMKYIDMVISETLRKWPIAVFGDRVCTKTYTIPPATPDEKSLTIQKGEFLSIPIFGIHRDPNYYPNPEKFDPERFNDENKSKINPYTYMPFGLGPRNCIGSRFALMEAKALIYFLLLNFEIVPTKKTQIPAKISTTGGNLSLEGGFNLGLKRIK